MLKVSTVIVTFNRLPLLKECIAAVKAQDYPIYQITVVNNKSTDGTLEYLTELCSDAQMKIVNLSENIGGAGGFNIGIKTAIQMGCDAVWVMDDDTIPYTDSLCKLCEVLEEHSSVGFLGSKVIWKDGTEHIMNMPKFVSLNDECQNVREITSSTFVSMLITSKAIKSVGLPFKEFFIWGDDVEYSNRIIRYGYKGLYVRDSVVIHKTTENYGPDLSNAPIETAWKFYYGRRNDMYIRRARYGYGLLFYIKELNHLRLALHNLSKRPKEQQAAFLKNVIRGFREGLTLAQVKTSVAI